MAFSATLASAAPAGSMDFHSPAWGVGLRYPATLVAGTIFKTNYFDRGAWRVSYAAGTGQGERILDLASPDTIVRDAGGTGTATAELRFGASRDPDVVATCLTYGMNSGNDVETRKLALGDVTFTGVPDNSDAEMGNAFTTEDYRAIYRGACYAIDLVQFSGGTSNRRPVVPEALLNDLRHVLSTVRFD